MTAERAPPTLPQVFITEEKEPLNCPPMSMHIAQEIATVSSRPASAMVRQTIAVTALPVSTPGRSARPAIEKPMMEIVRRPLRRSLHLQTSLSDSTPPATFVSVAARRGTLARPDFSEEKWRASRRYVGNQA